MPWIGWVGVALLCTETATAEDATARDAQPRPFAVTTPQPTNSATPASAKASRSSSEHWVEATRNRLVLHFTIEPASECGKLDDFPNRLRSRLTNVQFDEQGITHELQARVVPSDTKHGYRAQLTLTFPDGHRTVRSVETADCNEAIEALALIAAVAIDPSNADLSPTPRPPDLPPQASPLRRALAPRIIHGVVTPVPPTEPSRALAVGVAAAAFHGISPRWLLGFDTNLRLAFQRGAWWSPSLRLGFGYSAERGVVAQGGIADFTLLSTEFDGCLAPIAGRLVEVRWCGLLQAGRLSATGRSTEAPRTRHRPLVAIGAAGEVVVFPRARWGIPLRVQAAIPTNRDVFAFDPYAFHRVSGVLFGATAGFEARFQ
jgi:hypothetical protein